MKSLISLSNRFEPFNAVTKLAPPGPTQAEYVVAVQALLDSTAQAHHYDDIVSACSYAGAPNPFQAEGAQFVAWRGNCWAHCYAVLAAVGAGSRAQPSVAELIAEMPSL
jgi:hypothetical protein